MLSNIKILHSLRSVCYYFSTSGKISPCFDFYVVTCSYSSRTQPVLIITLLEEYIVN